MRSTINGVDDARRVGMIQTTLRAVRGGKRLAPPELHPYPLSPSAPISLSNRSLNELHSCYIAKLPATMMIYHNFSLNLVK